MFSWQFLKVLDTLANTETRMSSMEMKMIDDIQQSLQRHFPKPPKSFCC